MHTNIESPAVGQALVFAVHIGQPSQQQLAGHLEYLSADERRRAERFVIAPPREQFIVTRSALRHVLASMLGAKPFEIAFSYERSGKPRLRDGIGLHFNVSHSMRQALIAVAHVPVGIDLEIPAPSIRLHSLAQSVLSQSELQATAHLAPQALDGQVLDVWAAKESLLKAIGLGLSGGMQRISFALPLSGTDWFSPASIDRALQLELEEVGTCARTAWLDPASWCVRFLPAPAGGRAAIAVASSVERLDHREFEFPH